MLKSLKEQTVQEPPSRYCVTKKASQGVVKVFPFGQPQLSIDERWPECGIVQRFRQHQTWRPKDDGRVSQGVEEWCLQRLRLRKGC